MSPVKFLIIVGFILLVSCEAQNPEHYPDSYNKEVDRAMFKNYFPQQRNHGISISGNSKGIIAMCPVVSEDDPFITVDFEFEEGVDPKEIALLNVFMHKKEFVNNKWQWKAVADNYFLPNPYFNKVRIKNYLSEGEYRLWYGFYLRKDSLSEYPKFHKATCYLTID